MKTGLPLLKLPDRDIAAIGLGTARLGAFWQGRSVRDGQQALRTALQLGVGMIDTADVYARGIAERIIGSAVAQHPEALIITKAGLIKTPAAMIEVRRLGVGGSQRLSGLKPSRLAGKCFHPEYLRWAIDGSRKRLQQDTLKVFLLHEPEDAVLQEQSAAQMLAQLRQEGKIQRWGVSVRTAREAAAAMGLAGMSWLQIPAAVVSSPEFEGITAHPRRADVVIQAMAITGEGHRMLQDAAQSPQQKIARSVKAIVDQGIADSVLVGMSSGQRVYQNVAAIQRAYWHESPATTNGGQA